MSKGRYNKRKMLPIEIAREVASTSKLLHEGLGLSTENAAKVSATLFEESYGVKLGKLWWLVPRPSCEGGVSVCS